MRFSRALKVGAALALLLVVAGPAAAQRATTVPASAQVARPGRAYVTDPFGATVTVIDTTTFKIITVIPVGFLAFEATASPDGRVVYVTSESSVYVIDTATNAVTTVIPVGEFPQGIAFTPDGSKAYVANSASNTVSVIDTATRTVTDTIPLQEGSFPTEVAAGPNGSRVYVINSSLASVSVIDTTTNTVVATIPVGESPYGVVVSPNGSRAYVSNSASNTVSVINTATNTVVATIPVGASPKGIDIGPEGIQVYVVNIDDFTVSVIDTATNTVTDTLQTGVGSPISLDVTSRRVYVAAVSGQMVVIDRVLNSVIATVDISDPQSPSSASAWGLAVIESSTPPAGNPTLTTQASPNNIAGTLFSDTATLTGGLDPTGVVIFRLYSDVRCTAEAGSFTRPLVGRTATAQVILTAGTYYWRAVYTGDANNNPAGHPCNAPHESVVVSPFAPPPFTRTITGDFLGPLTVNAQESVQIVNARVVGPVTVNPGGSLVVVNSQISRGIVATSPGFLTICGSQVSGPSPNQATGVFNSTVPIQIGDPSSACAGNRFAGNVNLIGNLAATFDNNIVVGDVTVNNGGPGNTQIRSNKITGTLACAGNNPLDSTRPAVRNTAGARSGQCSGAF